MPAVTPASWRRPKNTTVMAPVSSMSVSSRAATPDHGCTRIEYTLPATRTRWRNCGVARSAIRSAGMSKSPMSMRWRRLGLGLAPCGVPWRLPSAGRRSPTGVMILGVGALGAEVVRHDGDVAVGDVVEQPWRSSRRCGRAPAGARSGCTRGGAAARVTSVSPSSRSRATTSAARPLDAPIGALDDVERQPGEAERAPARR